MNDKIKPWLLIILFFVFTIGGAIFKNFFIILIGIISLIVLFVSSNSWFKKMKRNSHANFSNKLKQYNFIADKKILTNELLTGLAISKDGEQIALLQRKTINDEFDVKIFNFKDIVEAKVITEKETLVNTSLGSIVTRGAIGTILFGGLGGIVGGVTAKTNSTQKVKELTLEIVVDDLLYPRHTVTFYKKDIPINNSNTIINEIEDWYRTFSIIIKRNNQEVRSV
jgi:hypothetical protein